MDTSATATAAEGKQGTVTYDGKPRATGDTGRNGGGIPPASWDAGVNNSYIPPASWEAGRTATTASGGKRSETCDCVQ